MDRLKIPRTDYRGSDLKRREKLREEDRLCIEIEAAMQKQYDATKAGNYVNIGSADIALSIGRDIKKVRDLIFRIDAGHNGLTLWKPEV
jgi:hypothetical protein